ncbi:MAG: hypothetical protein PVH38_05005 [Gammaproteobacteria bacterium]|jgi:hypothetical protein
MAWSLHPALLLYLPPASGRNLVCVAVTAQVGASTRSYTLAVTRQSRNEFARQACIMVASTANTDISGSSVVAAGGPLSVGALEDSSATGVDGDAADNIIRGAGVAFAFRRAAAG